MQHYTSLIIIAVLVLFGIYRRVRRTIGFQKLVKGSMIARMVLFIVIGAIFLSTGFMNPIVYAYDVIGIVVGGIIAYYAMRTTSFEWRNKAWFYRPNPWIGALLLVLFIGRIAYRVYEEAALVGATTSAHVQSSNQFSTYSHDPLTSIVLFVLITYYVAYYAFVIRKSRHLNSEASANTSEFS